MTFVFKKIIWPFLLFIGCFNTHETKQNIPRSSGFDFPVGTSINITPVNDGDGWYNANPFGNDRHLGDDWNAESGGNSDCGKSVFSISEGQVIYAKDAGPGWGNVVIIRHQLPNGNQVESLYGHLKEIEVNALDTIKRKQKIGTIGDGEKPCGDSKPYYAHLHFELREPSCNYWGLVGPGYQSDFSGFLDPTKFIRANRKF